jgi:peptide deformylase
MAIRMILTYPDYAQPLRCPCAPVPEINDRVQQLVLDLKDTLSGHTDGIGLAAPQINFSQRVVIVRFDIGNGERRKFGPPIALINPTILEAKDERRDYDGCLSFPNLFGETVRPHYLRVSGLDEEGNHFERVFEGFDAVTVHHEIDHLDGVLFIDRIKNKQDLYRVVKNDVGELVHVPLEAEMR